MCTKCKTFAFGSYTYSCNLFRSNVNGYHYRIVAQTTIFYILTLKVIVLTLLMATFMIICRFIIYNFFISSGTTSITSLFYCLIIRRRGRGICNIVRFYYYSWFFLCTGYCLTCFTVHYGCVVYCYCTTLTVYQSTDYLSTEFTVSRSQICSGSLSYSLIFIIIKHTTSWRAYQWHVDKNPPNPFELEIRNNLTILSVW